MSDPSMVRSLAFDHAGESYVVAAAPGLEGWDLALFRGGARVRGFGVVPYTDAEGADRAAVGLDQVEERLCAIRDAVLLGDVS